MSKSFSDQLDEILKSHRVLIIDKAFELYEKKDNSAFDMTPEDIADLLDTNAKASILALIEKEVIGEDIEHDTNGEVGYRCNVNECVCYADYVINGCYHANVTF